MYDHEEEGSDTISVTPGDGVTKNLLFALATAWHSYNYWTKF